jgi:hypothetical protein
MASTIYTKNGRPLQRVGDDLFAKSGLQVARLRGDRAFGPDGRYVGTLVNDRLIYRSAQNAAVGSSFSPRRVMGSALVNRAGTAAWGEEPPIPD